MNSPTSPNSSKLKVTELEPREVAATFAGTPEADTIILGDNPRDVGSDNVALLGTRDGDAGEPFVWGEGRPVDTSDRKPDQVFITSSPLLVDKSWFRTDVDIADRSAFLAINPRSEPAAVDRMYNPYGIVHDIIYPENKEGFVQVGTGQGVLIPNVSTHNDRLDSVANFNPHEGDKLNFVLPQWADKNSVEVAIQYIPSIRNDWRSLTGSKPLSRVVVSFNGEDGQKYLMGADLPLPGTGSPTAIVSSLIDNYYKEDHEAIRRAVNVYTPEVTRVEFTTSPDEYQLKRVAGDGPEISRTFVLNECKTPLDVPNRELVNAPISTSPTTQTAARVSQSGSTQTTATTSEWAPPVLHGVRVDTPVSSSTVTTSPTASTDQSVNPPMAYAKAQRPIASEDQERAKGHVQKAASVQDVSEKKRPDNFVHPGSLASSSDAKPSLEGSSQPRTEPRASHGQSTTDRVTGEETQTSPKGRANHHRHQEERSMVKNDVVSFLQTVDEASAQSMNLSRRAEAEREQKKQEKNQR